jgi:hypothetical protein
VVQIGPGGFAASAHVAAHKIARLTKITEGGAYQMLLGALIEAERLPRGSILGFSMTADE